MKRIAHLTLATLLGCAGFCPRASPTPNPEEPHVMQQQERDPHRWLENVDDPKALAWVQAHNAKTFAALGSDEQAALEARLLQIFESQDRIPYVSKRGDYLYNFWQDDQHIRGLWRRTTLEEYRKPHPAWETVLDVDALAQAEQESWVFAGATWLQPQYHRAMLTLSRGGGDAAVVREYDVVHKRFVDGGFALPEAKSSVDWKDPDTLFVGTDFGPGTLTSSGYPRVVKEWRRGTPLSAARSLFAGEDSDVSVSLVRKHLPGGAHLDIVRRRTGFFSSEVYIRDGDETKRIDRPTDASVFFFRDQVIFRPRTPWQVTPERTWPAGSLVTAPLSAYLQGDRNLQPIYLPQPDQALQDLVHTENALVLTLLQDVKSRVLVARFTADGTFTQSELTVPPLSTTRIIPYDSQASDRYFRITSGYLTPSTLALGEIDAGPAEDVRVSKAFFDTAGLEVTQHFATSKDGTRIPYFQVARAGLAMNGTHPTLLTAYGGFELSQTPAYNASVGAAWLERGGVFVEANIRGGGEYGPQWHAAARKEHRQRAYDDFIAVAEDLIHRGVTTPQRLGIRGGSNGGLLVGVALTQRPDLWGAVICLVPLLDMQRYHHLLAGASWMAEYGDPDVPEEWATIATYSPYHHVRADAPYPRVLFATSTRDDRVHPGHARKMVALMQAQRHPVLYFENNEGGHAAATNAKQLARRSALEFSYLYQQLCTARQPAAAAPSGDSHTKADLPDAAAKTE